MNLSIIALHSKKSNCFHIIGFLFITILCLSSCGGGGSAPSTSDLSKPLSAPSNVKLDLIGNNQISITWDEVEQAESYRVYSALASISTLGSPDLSNYSSLDGYSVQDISKNNTFVNLYALDYGKDYFVIVQAIGYDNTTANSQEKSQKTNVPKPQNVNFTQNELMLKISWDNIVGVDTYDVYTSQGDLSNKTMAQIKALESSTDITKKVTRIRVTNATNYELTGLARGDRRYGFVVAIVDDVQSEPSILVSKTVERFYKLMGYENKCIVDIDNNKIWEVKQEKGLHSKEHTYSWYDPNPKTNGGNEGAPNRGECHGSSDNTRCDTQKFAMDVNTVGWCGFNDWRLPTVSELKTLILNTPSTPKIDTRYFPNTGDEDGSTASYLYWSSTTYDRFNSVAWNVHFYYGNAYNYTSKSLLNRVRLIRDR